MEGEGQPSIRTKSIGIWFPPAHARHMTHAAYAAGPLAADPAAAVSGDIGAGLRIETRIGGAAAGGGGDIGVNGGPYGVRLPRGMATQGRIRWRGGIICQDDTLWWRTFLPRQAGGEILRGDMPRRRRSHGGARRCPGRTVSRASRQQHDRAHSAQPRRKCPVTCVYMHYRSKCPCSVSPDLRGRATTLPSAKVMVTCVARRACAACARGRPALSVTST